MECERLVKLIKNWYLQVQDEALAPARMVDFMHAHLGGCPVCENDPVVESEVKKIVEKILPPTKIPKAVRREDEEEYEDEVAPRDREDDDSEAEEEEEGEEVADDDDLDDLDDEDDDF